MNGMQNNAKNLIEILEEIHELENDLERMVDAWDSDDPCAQAENDPGLQHSLAIEISALWNEFYRVVKDKEKNDG